MIAALPLGHAAGADPLDGRAENRIAAHQQRGGPARNPPASAARLRRCARSPCLRHTYDSESDAVGVGIRRDLVAIRAPQHRHVVVHPGSAANDAHAAGVGSARIVHVAAAVVFAAVPVGHPFPHVSHDVAQTEGVGRIGAGRPCAALALGRRILEKVAARRVDLVAPRITAALRRRRAPPFPIPLRSAAGRRARSPRRATGSTPRASSKLTSTTGWLPWPGRRILVLPDVRSGQFLEDASRPPVAIRGKLAQGRAPDGRSP